MAALLIGALFAASVISTGFGVLRLNRLATAVTALGLSPAAGLGVLIVVTTWSGFLGLSPVFGALLLIGGGGLGVIVAVRDRHEWRTALAASVEVRLAFLLVGASMAATAVVLGGAFNGIVVPLSSDDGAHHVEIINQLRQGGQWSGWYPHGFHSLAAAFLQLLPSVDTALGAVGVGLGLALLAPLSVFGLGLAILRRLPAAAAASVLVGLTAQYPYHLQFWDGWPLAIGIILATGLWNTAAYYLERPRPGWALFGALLAASTLLTHGTELVTAAIGLAFVLIAGWRRVNWMLMLPHLALAFLVAAVLMLPYLPGLLDFYRGGGAQGAGDAELGAMSAPSSGLARLSGTVHLALDTVGGFIVDAPVRLGIVLAGAASTFRARRGRLLAPLALTFVGLAVAFQGFDLPVIGRLYALTFPWSQDYRLLMITAICACLMGGAGLVAIVGWASRQRSWRSAPAVLLVLIVFAQGSIALMAERFSGESLHYLTYSGDDAVALEWLDKHIRPGELLVNDGSADAGIWAPYKAGASILLPRVLPVPDMTGREQLVRHIGDLQDSPQTLAEACGLGARYVYSGASGTLYEKRQFPPPATLQQSAALDEVFSQGAAAVFRLRCE